MRRRHLLIITCCLFCPLVWGCSSQARPNKAAIESKLKDSLKLQDIHLTETEQGKYEGTGRSEDGTTYKVKATHTQGKSNGLNYRELRWEAEDSKGHKITGGDKSGGNQ
jgi:hypothetical protein